RRRPRPPAGQVARGSRPYDAAHPALRATGGRWRGRRRRGRLERAAVMSSPTPRFVPAVNAAPELAEGGRPAARTPLKLETVSPTPRPKPRRPRWTIMLVPPPRVPGRVRSVELKRRHAAPPLAILVLVLAVFSYGSA